MTRLPGTAVARQLTRGGCSKHNAVNGRPLQYDKVNGATVCSTHCHRVTACCGFSVSHVVLSKAMQHFLCQWPDLFAKLLSSSAGCSVLMSCNCHLQAPH